MKQHVKELKKLHKNINIELAPQDIISNKSKRDSFIMELIKNPREYAEPVAEKSILKETSRYTQAKNLGVKFAREIKS